MAKSMPVVSVVVPVFNEAKSISLIYDELKKAVADLSVQLEIIFVDDGSQDSSYEEIKLLNSRDRRIRGIRFSRNFGHQAALWAGLAAASGDAVISIDADLQQPPGLIPVLIRKWQEGSEIVQTVREEVKGGTVFKKATSRLFYLLINRIGRSNIIPGAADFRLLDKKVIEEIKRTNENTLFLRGLLPWMGFKTTIVKYHADTRKFGRSKYSVKKMLSFALDGIISQSSFPLRLSFLLGISISFLSFLYGAYAVYQKLFNEKVIAGWTSVIISVLFLGGVQLTMVGIIGEYLGRVFDQVRGRPRYIISDII
jgi:glycosyltransferase involved in cell wall biosynthesis